MKMKMTSFLKSRFIKVSFVMFAAFALAATVTSAQFNSGSTGADGALNTSTLSCANNICEIQLPPSGILNYTTVNIGTGTTVRFKRNDRNTAVILLAQGNVTISGGIEVNSGDYVPCASPSGRCFDYRLGGPGGFAGGQQGSNGFGPGGGISGLPPGGPDLRMGRWVGPLSLVPIVGGSGGADGGDGGGGAIVIASSTSIEHSGHINAGATNRCAVLGSGGAIRLVSNSIVATGSFYAKGTGHPSCVSGGDGIVRLEATDLSFTGTSQPAAILSAINANIGLGAMPQLTIVSIGGFSVPSSSGRRFDTVDLMLPSQIPDPINVVVQAINIPVGTPVGVGFVNGSPSGTSVPCNLAGSFSNSSCTATISNLVRTAVTYLLATAAFDPPAALAKHNPPGAAHVARVRMEATLGGPTRYVFLDKGGKIIEEARIAPYFLSYFGK